MSSYGELLAACNEFRENFTTLNGKYTTLVQELQTERERTDRLTRQLEAAHGNEEKANGTIRELRKELDEARSYKDLYLAATVSVEHLKGRLENARHAVADNILEQEQQVEQLRTQIKDLKQRLNVSADAAATQQLKRQVLELEERCALQNSQLMEERERFSQQLLTAHTALREQQARQLEVEQRCRSLEAEVAQMRSVVRRSADLQNDAAVSREKSASDARKAALQVESLKTELHDAEARLNEVESSHAEALEALRAEADEEKAQLLERVSQLSASLDDAVAARIAEQEKYAVLQRSIHQRVEAARSDARVEVINVQKLLADTRLELQQYAWRMDQVQAELDEKKRLLQQREGKIESSAAEFKQLRLQLDAANQREAWLSAERDNISQHLDAARKQVQDLTAAQCSLEESGLEAERLRIQVQFLEDELREARRLVDVYEGKLKDSEAEAERRARALRQEVRSVKKLMKAENAKSEIVRRRLVQALLDRETEAWRHGRCETAPHGPPSSHSVNRGGDVIDQLKRQDEQAQVLHQRLIELSRCA
ncbi:hypothetical protein ERJ75_001370000 [Trypanosoma vivax]|nr:hypothetical protein ERJ75_001370000 [Trypanosoma vivax]